MMNRALLFTILLGLSFLLACASTVAAPVARFEALPTQGGPPLDVEFTDLSEGEINGWEWDFDSDGFVDSVDQNPQHSFVEVGNYTVTLIVTGPGGHSSDAKEIKIFTPLCRADFEANQTSVSGFIPARFTDLSGGDIVSWEWDFNDDGIVDSNLQNPTYTYRRNGNYTVTLTVELASGQSDTETKVDYISVTGCKT